MVVSDERETMSQTSINERFGRLLKSQHEVMMAVTALLIEVIDQVAEEGTEEGDRLLAMVNETAIAIDSARLLLVEGLDA